MTRQIVSQPPATAPAVADLVEEEAEDVSDVARAREAALATFKAQQVENWISQIAESDKAGLPFVLDETSTKPADEQRPNARLSGLYGEF
jgi:hypothetical protein